MKKLIFVSAGRCGTTRIAQILTEYLPVEFSVQHQMPFSRLANIIGNVFFYLGRSEKIKSRLYNSITARYYRGKHFICTDPLTSMIIPREHINSKDVCIVHIFREPKEFAESFFRFSRKKAKSFIAHNFIPLWQIGVWPMENLINKNIQKKYSEIMELKNKYFEDNYSFNPNYIKVGMDKIFNSDFLGNKILNFFNYNISITDKDLKIKAN
jgi:hypothetical protein